MGRYSKSQTATEYMVILAVVIIIALIVIAILGQFPAIGSSTRGRASIAFWQGSDIGIISHAISEDGANDDVLLKIRNNMKDSITITSIKFDAVEIFNTSTTLGPGETRTLDIPDAGNYCSSAGDSYTIEIYVRYKDDETGETFSYTGSGTKLEGKCAE